MVRDVCVIIPVYNETKVIRQTIERVAKDYPFIVCVNDGSKDDSSEEILKTSAVLIEHYVNLGQGAALQTGLEFGLQFPEVKYFVTFDGDGQHDIKDVRAMLKRLKKENLDVVLGSRFLGSTNVHLSKKLLLKTATGFTNMVSGTKLTDTHNGMRVFNRKVAKKLNITIPGMAHASEIVDIISQNNWRYAEEPVTIHYSDYSRSKGQSMLNSVNILIEFLLNKVTK